jgi:hypothetical protein
MSGVPNRSLIAIFGAGRNGSTLMGRVLDGAPGLWMHPVETNYLCVWDDLARRGSLSGPTLMNARTHTLTALDRGLQAEALLGVFRGHWREIEQVYVNRVEGPVEVRESPEARVAARTSYAVDEFLPAFLAATQQAYDTHPEASVFAFKTIETPYVDDYLRVFPGLRCIHTIRQPEDNYASAKRTWTYHKSYPFYYGGADLLRTFLDARWLPHARSAASLCELDPEHHHLVRYEDITLDPATVVAGICSWLGLDPPDTPDQLTVLGGRRMGRMPSNPSQAGLEQPERVVADMQREHAYIEVLTVRERDFIDRCTGELAKRLGYEPRGGSPSAVALFIRWLPPDESERLHRRSWVRWAFEIVRRRLYVGRKLFLTRRTR